MEEGSKEDVRAMNNNEKSLLWHYCEDVDLLFGSEQEAIEDFVDQQIEGDSIPSSMKLYAWRPMNLQEGAPDPEMVLNFVLEHLEEVYGNPEGNPDIPGYYDDPTPAIRKAAEEFCNVIRSEYAPWQCERCPEMDTVVDMKEWTE